MLRCAVKLRNWNIVRLASLCLICLVFAKLCFVSQPDSRAAGCDQLLVEDFSVKNLPPLPSVESYIRQLSTRTPFRTDGFAPQIMETELRALLELMRTLLDLLEQRGIRAMLYGSSLLGSYRHHGILPWDDKVSLLLKAADKARLVEAMKHRPDLNLNQLGNRWKLSSLVQCFRNIKHGCWPLIDLYFYEARDGWLVVDGSGFEGESEAKRFYPAKYTLPAHRRPFMGSWVDSPRDALNFLAFATEPTSKCSSLSYSQRLETQLAVEVTDCQKLAEAYPFVLRVPNEAPSCRGVLETLSFTGAEPMYTVAVSEPLGALNMPYSTLPVRLPPEMGG